MPSYSRAFIGEIDDEDITFDQVRHSLSSQKRKRKQKYSLTAVVQSCYILPNLLDGANICKLGLPVDLQGGEGNSLGKSSVRLY